MILTPIFRLTTSSSKYYVTANHARSTPLDCYKVEVNEKLLNIYSLVNLSRWAH